ncbi:MAG: glycosyltransferase [Silvanigrellaceae bacterium]|nr:glycosyltransferase [Silvanigrellaceae bacterium]
MAIKFLENREITYVFIDLLPGGGAEKQMLIQAQALIEQGYKVKFLVKKIDEKHFYTYCPNGIYSKNVFRGLLSSRGKPVISSLSQDHKYCLLFAFFNYIKWIPSEQTHPNYYFSSPSLFKKLTTIAKFIVLFFFCSFFAKALIVQTQDAKEKWRNLFIFNRKKKIFVLANIFSKPSIKETKQNATFKILMVGRLVYEKDYFFALASLSHLKKLCPEQDFQADIYGLGPEEDNLKHYTLSHDLTYNVKFKGFTKNIDEVYHSYDLYIMTSRHEGMPNALGEAMSKGLPCIVLNFLAGPKDLLGYHEVSDLSGQIVEQRDPQKFAERIKIFMENESIRIEKSRQNVKRIESFFGKENFCSNFENIIKQI